MYFSSYLFGFRLPRSVFGSNWDCSEATCSNSAWFSLESVFNLLKATWQDDLCADLPILVFQFLILTFVLGAVCQTDRSKDLATSLTPTTSPRSWSSQDWLCDRGASSDGVLDVSDKRNKKGRKKSCSFHSFSYSRTSAPPPKNPICARPVYVKDKQPAVKSVFSVVGLFATRAQRKGTLVEQTPRILDQVDNLQAGFPGWHSHSAYIHLHLLKRPGRARPVITGTFPVVFSMSGLEVFVIPTTDVAFGFPVLEQRKPGKETQAGLLAGRKPTWLVSTGSEMTSQLIQSAGGGDWRNTIRPEMKIQSSFAFD